MDREPNLDIANSDYVSLRDYFASKALNGMLSYAWFNPMDDEELTDRVRMAYRTADKMLEIRNESKRKRQSATTKNS